MKENNTVVRGHFKPNAEQLARIAIDEANCQRLQDAAAKAGYHQSEVENLSFEPWMIDHNWLLDEGLEPWGNLGIDASRLYPAIVSLPLSSTDSVVLFSLGEWSDRRAEWAAQIRIHHIELLDHDGATSVEFRDADNADQPFAFRVKPCGDDLDIRLEGGLDVHLLLPAIANSVDALCRMLQRQANKVALVDQCA